MTRVDKIPEGFTAEQWQAFQAATQGFGEQDENGVDLSLLRENLKLTPTERLLRLQAELKALHRIERA